MRLIKTYFYKLDDGRTERTHIKMSPAMLKRANVPEDLIDEYNRIADIEHILWTHNEKGVNADKIEAIKPAVSAAYNAITDFLEEQEKEQFPE